MLQNGNRFAELTIARVEEVSSEMSKATEQCYVRKEWKNEQ